MPQNWLHKHFSDSTEANTKMLKAGENASMYIQIITNFVSNYNGTLYSPTCSKI